MGFSISFTWIWFLNLKCISEIVFHQQKTWNVLISWKPIKIFFSSYNFLLDNFQLYFLPVACKTLMMISSKNDIELCRLLHFNFLCYFGMYNNIIMTPSNIELWKIENGYLTKNNTPLVKKSLWESVFHLAYPTCNASRRELWHTS